MKHLIVTRYNLGLFSDPSSREQVPDPEAWMEHRLPIFRTFTWASMKGQTCQDFTWYLLLDPQTPVEHRAPLERLALPNMRLVDLRVRHVKFLQQEARPHDVVMTSRIDNDDAWHRTTVDMLQRRYHRPTRLVDLAQSYWLDLARRTLHLKRSRWLRWIRPQPGPFSSLVENGSSAKTILIDQHPRLHRHVRWWQVKPVTRGVFNLVVCHERNQGNRIDNAATGPSVNLDILKEFNISLEG